MRLNTESRARRARARKWFWWANAPLWLVFSFLPLAGVIEWTVVERASLFYIGAVSIVTQATAEQATEESARDAVE